MLYLKGLMFAKIYFVSSLYPLQTLQAYVLFVIEPEADEY